MKTKPKDKPESNQWLITNIAPVVRKEMKLTCAVVGVTLSEGITQAITEYMQKHRNTVQSKLTGKEVKK